MMGQKHENAVPSGEAGGLTMRKVPVAVGPDDQTTCLLGHLKA